MKSHSHVSVNARLMVCATSVVIFCLHLPAMAQTSGPGPSIGEMMHNTFSSFNPTRTTIAIGEIVFCEVDPDTFDDPYYEYDPETGSYDIGPYQDVIASWLWTSTGSDYASVYPTTGAWSELSTQIVSVASNITVLAQVTDTRGNAATRQTTFSVVPPTDAKAIAILSNDPLGTPSTQNPQSYGASTTFVIQVLPNTVDFGWSLEDSIAEQVLSIQHQYPNGVWTTIPGKDTTGEADPKPKLEDTTVNTVDKGQMFVLNGMVDDVGDTYRCPLSNLADQYSGLATTDSFQMTQKLFYNAFVPNQGAWVYFPFKVDQHGFYHISNGQSHTKWDDYVGGTQGPYSDAPNSPY
jgi:hypothetical protein